MNPMLNKVLISAVRGGLQLAAGYLVTKGVWSQDQSSEIVSGLAVAIVTVVWSVYEKYKSQQLLVTMGAAAGVSENQAKAMVDNPAISTPTVTTPKDQVPVPL